MKKVFLVFVIIGLFYCQNAFAWEEPLTFEIKSIAIDGEQATLQTKGDKIFVLKKGDNKWPIVIDINMSAEVLDVSIRGLLQSDREKRVMLKFLNVKNFRMFKSFILRTGEVAGKCLFVEAEACTVFVFF